jgi:Protein of unknown function (DUF1822)
MTSSFIYPEEFRGSLPEVMWLETHHFRQAKELCQRSPSELIQEQNYASALALFGFSQWLEKKMSDSARPMGHSPMTPSVANFTEGVCQFKVGEFKLCLIAGEYVLDETVQIPRIAIFRPELAAHFYIVLEVHQAEEQVILKGVLQHDQLTHYLRQADELPAAEGLYSIPLSLFDPEPNHLLSYLRYLNTSTIPLPLPLVNTVETSSVSKTRLRDSLTSTNAQLKNWLQDFF